MLRVPEPEDVTRELDRDVLEAPSGADERHVSLACQPDRVESPLHAPVRAGRRDEDAAEAGEPLRGGAGAVPVATHSNAQPTCPRASSVMRCVRFPGS